MGYTLKAEHEEEQEEFLAIPLKPAFPRRTSELMSTRTCETEEARASGTEDVNFIVKRGPQSGKPERSRVSEGVRAGEHAEASEASESQSVETRVETDKHRNLGLTPSTGGPIDDIDGKKKFKARYLLKRWIANNCLSGRKKDKQAIQRGEC